jgi:2-dehydropantoate 2-reductase
VKILVYGAGVIGTLYAARLQEGGHRVTVVARGRHFRSATVFASAGRLVAEICRA